MHSRLIALTLLVPALAAAQNEVEPAPLSGPPVTEQRIEGVESGFSSMTASGLREEPTPMSVFRAALAELGGDRPPEGAGLSDPQRQRLRAIQREHRRALAALRRQHAEEVRHLREALGPQLARRLGLEPDRRRPDRRGAESDRADKGAPAPEPMTGVDPQPPARGELTDAQRAAMARLRELRAQAPGPEEVQTRIWAELNEAQRAHVQMRIDEHRARAAEQRQAAYVRRMAARRDAGADPAEAVRPPALAPELLATLESLPPSMRMRLAELPPERLERALQRLSRLSPEERAQFLRRLRQDRPRPGDTADHASPPSIDRVNVPDPEASRKRR